MYPLLCSSQRMDKVVMEHSGSSGLTFWLMWDHPGAHWTRLCPDTSLYLQRGTIHNLLGQSIPVLCCPYSKDFLLHIQGEIPVHHFLPVASYCWASPRKAWLHSFDILPSGTGAPLWLVVTGQLLNNMEQNITLLMKIYVVRYTDKR